MSNIYNDVDVIADHNNSSSIDRINSNNNFDDVNDFIKYINECLFKYAKLKDIDYSQEHSKQNFEFDIEFNNFMESLTEVFHFSKKINDIYTFHRHIKQLVKVYEDITLSKGTNKNQYKWQSFCKPYNKSLNYLKQKIQINSSKNHDLDLIRHAFLAMPFYDRSCKFERIVSSNSKIEAIFENKSKILNKTTEKSIINYDGYKIENEMRVICIPRPQYEKGNIIKFGFDSYQTALYMLLNAVEECTPADLITLENNLSLEEKLLYGGVLQKSDSYHYHFRLKLRLKHEFNNVLIDSSSTKLMYILSGLPLNHRTIKLYLSESLVNNLYDHCENTYKWEHLRFYIQFHNAVIKKIQNLISMQMMNPNYNYVCFECYCPKCAHITIRSKIGLGKTVICMKCNFSEFCTKCWKSFHGNSACEKADNATMEWINQNTKPCPTCKIVTFKYDGCNHVTCKACRIEWCWLCGETYENNNRQRHYAIAGGSDYAVSCIGLKNRENAKSLSNSKQDLPEDPNIITIPVDNIIELRMHQQNAVAGIRIIGILPDGSVINELQRDVIQINQQIGNINNDNW